jgi:C4-dicarboxylate-specific signal transduction histidine kinase
VPFFTTKRTGSGIGLSLSRQMMMRYGVEMLRWCGGEMLRW